MTASALARPHAIAAALRARLRDAAAAVDEKLSLLPALRDLMHLPVLRPLARRRAGALFDLCAGFVYSQVLAACVEADLFAFLRGGPRAAGEIAHRAGLPPDSAEKLIEAAVALRLMRRRR
ncbi:MAG: methyltransferase, partial [Caulobacteraceae bacterium]|nr:methyltransferase [Caulobacter sp.]